MGFDLPSHVNTTSTSIHSYIHTYIHTYIYIHMYYIYVRLDDDPERDIPLETLHNSTPTSLSSLSLPLPYLSRRFEAPAAPPPLLRGAPAGSLCGLYEEKHTKIHIYIHTCISCMHACMHTYIIRTYIHTYIHTHIQTNKQTYIHTNIQTNKHTYIRTYIHTYIRSHILVCLPLVIVHMTIDFVYRTFQLN